MENWKLICFHTNQGLHVRVINRGLLLESGSSLMDIFYFPRDLEGQDALRVSKMRGERIKKRKESDLK